MGYFSYNCQVCGRDLMSKASYKGTPDWMKDVVVFMPDGIKIEGEYTGFGAVKTGKTVWSSFVRRKREEEYLKRGESLILVDGGKFFDKTKANADHGYLSMYMWYDHYIYNPCCYHRACWEAVGSPEGYRGPSLRSQDQGFGSAARLYGVQNYGDIEHMDDGNGPIIDFLFGLTVGRPALIPETIGLWAVNSIVHFFCILTAWTGHCQRAEEQREMWRSFAGIEALFENIDTILAFDKKS